jgi:ribonuclease HII
LKRLQEKQLPTFQYEKEANGLGARRIAGIDEAGRGPLAGPVVAAAVILPSFNPIQGLDDSKRLAQSARERLFDRIRNEAVSYRIGIISPEIIDEINILQATRLAMVRAVESVEPPPDFLLIDGPIQLDIDIRQRSIIKGDRLSASVAAAGIMAKVTRDRIMLELHEKYPAYGFNRHKGYGTKAHKDALVRYGPSPVHRKCFKGVTELLSG